ncbi:MAG: glycosyl hydrolase family protein [Gemmatimonadetes bacterium]|nr:glycosyl hydrolase family protein [Gemmatimonadota bacterium]
MRQDWRFFGSSAAASAALVMVLAGCREQPTSPPAMTPDASTFAAARRPAKPPAEQLSFIDYLDGYDTARWLKADGWTNGSPFDNAWLADHITFAGGLMSIRLDDQRALGEPYSSGNYQSVGFHGYGCYEASFRPVPVPGTVTSFFTFAGPYDNGGNGSHNEIDIEFLGNHFLAGNTEVQFNFYANDDAYASRNEHLHPLGFDAAAAFHRYGFRWTSAGIAWYVDGVPVYQVADSPEHPTPKAAESLQKIMMNLWPVDATAAAWAGTFVYPGQPLEASYQWVRFVRGEDCTLDVAPQEPPPPSGDPGVLHVSGVALQLAARNTQAVARVTVVDGTGQPAAGTTVTGTWSGSITTGDALRETGTDGVATFYSARSRTIASVTFCVTGVTRAGSTYDATKNLATCGTVSP